MCFSFIYRLAQDGWMYGWMDGRTDKRTVADCRRPSRSVRRPSADRPRTVRRPSADRPQFVRRPEIAVWEFLLLQLLLSLLLLSLHTCFLPTVAEKGESCCYAELLTPAHHRKPPEARFSSARG